VTRKEVDMCRPSSPTGPSSLSGHGRSLALLLPLLLAACGPDAKTPGWTFAPAEPPPPADQELVPPPPEGASDQAVWEFGHWHREGQEYTWVPGHYVEPSNDEAVGSNGRWVYTGNHQSIWIPGHMQKE